MFRLKLDLDFDLDQLLKWESCTVGLIEGREHARSNRHFYFGRLKRFERIEFNLTVLPDIIEACIEIVSFYNKIYLLTAEVGSTQVSYNSEMYEGFNNKLYQKVKSES